ncbi:uncharacterized protein GGS22DRAFT_151593 [Annulohypoxylon maeteangense]|uniref:uncharacterized protein n=1 Tax=Annulohypoxylon maeteangense TaxID=1927788 RepID=UPI002007B18A|nr:uncharacterized protein GGS22DRAFT_151593 [Annulohypoxylon maeteangense]KAI0890688.1 hypothetical protein GGS22DRAFT_151593 [Annulohypoxylon maeteangense]
MTTPEVSHGRGGAGNIHEDNTKYVDGEIVREGTEGSHGDGAFSTGRGGAANIADTSVPAAARADREVVPEEATRPSTDDASFHVGRGGAANVHLSQQDQQKQEAKHATPAPAPAPAAAAKVVDSPAGATAAPKANQGLADKLKNKIFGVFKK